MPPAQLGLDLPRGGDKRAYVRAMFAAIAPRYDLLNRLLSLTIDQRWRRLAIRRLGWDSRPDGTYLDLCAGTLDLAAQLAGQAGFGGRVIGADFVVPMLRRGRHKAAAVVPVAADALRLPFGDAQFDGAVVGFGVRNLADLDRGFAEAARVLKPGAPFVVLEFSTPRPRVLRWLYLFYFRRILPAIGRLVSRHGTAYAYLRDSVLAFPSPDQLAERMRRAGFRDVTYESLTWGIAVLHRGVRA